jgi:DNA helicase HerA-like ATPase
MSNQPKSDLYANAAPIGLLKGFSPVPHQLEVDVVVPHDERGLPGFGEFLLVELSATAALVGRVSRYHAAGQLATGQGDAYLADLAIVQEAVPGQIMRQMLRYNLKMQLLGQLQAGPSGLAFSVGERSFATLGSHVRGPSETALAFLCNVGLENDPTAAPLGSLVYGQRVLSGVPVNFSVARLKGKRSFVFARAGYGKSNLIKYLVSQLYSSPPDVGLLIFDPEGEYALPDVQGRPGLVNVPGLQGRVSLYTNRRAPAEYAAVRKGDVFVDFGDFPPQDIVAAFVPAEKQEMVFANLLRSLDWDVWRKLVQLLAKDGFAADNNAIAKLLAYKPRQEDVSLGAIKNNLVPAIKRLHRAGATVGKNIIEELRQGRVVIIDISLLGSEDALSVTGLILRRLFQHNIRHLTEAEGPTVRCLAVLEEAQTMLGDRRLDDNNIFVRWVKEGRKYGLGAILVTQQPGAIAPQIISQGDNFFALHLLNDDDLQTLKRHNAYYTDEILNYLRAEPIVGNCYFWSAPNQPFVLPVRVANFESVCQKPTGAAIPTPTSKKSPPPVAEAVRNALESNSRVWLYPVRAFNGREDKGWVAFSVDYLQATVSQTISDNLEGLPREIANVLQRHKARNGYAVLEGVTRPVWAILQSDLKLKGQKKPRPTVVEVSDKL